MSKWDKYAEPENTGSGKWDKYADAPDYEAEATLAADKKFEETKPGMFESAKLGVYQGLTRNFGDELVGKIGGLMGNDEEATKANVRSRIERSKEDQPVAYTAGEIGSKIASLPVTANPLAAAGIAAADTAVSGVGDDKSAGRIAAETAGAGLTAGLATKYMPMLSEAGKSKLASLLQGRADKQLVKATGATQKMIQDAGDKIPALAQHMRDNKLITPFSSSQKIADNIASFGDDLAAKSKPIYEQSAESKMPREQLLSLIDDKIDSLKSNPGNAPIVAKLESYKNAIYDSNVSSMNPSELKDFRQVVAKTVNFNADAPSQIASKDMYGVLRGAEMGQIEKVDPALRAANEGLFKSIHLNRIAEDMSEKGAARSTANNDIGLNTWQAMNVAADAGSGGVWTVVAGAVREGARRFGPQLQGIYLDKAAKAMQNPKSAKIIEEAAKRSPEAVVAALAVIDKMVD